MLNPKLDVKETDPPVLKKFLFCFSLRTGLLLFSVIQPFSDIFIQCSAIYEHEQYPDFSRETGTYKLLFMNVSCITTSIDCAIYATFLLEATKKKPCNLFLELMYYYQIIKVVIYAIVLVGIFFFKHFMGSVPFGEQLDSARHFFLVEEQALGLIDLELQFYVMLAIKSYIIELGHKMVFGTLMKWLWQICLHILRLSPDPRPKPTMTLAVETKPPEEMI